MDVDGRRRRVRVSRVDRPGRAPRESELWRSGKAIRKQIGNLRFSTPLASCITDASGARESAAAPGDERKAETRNHPHPPTAAAPRLFRYRLTIFKALFAFDKPRDACVAWDPRCTCSAPARPASCEDPQQSTFHEPCMEPWPPGAPPVPPGSRRAAPCRAGGAPRRPARGGPRPDTRHATRPPARARGTRSGTGRPRRRGVRHRDQRCRLSS